METTPYTWGACGTDCHRERYALFATRVRLRRRWGVWDNHLDRALPTLRMNREGTERWLESLLRMEHMERYGPR